MYDAKDRVIVAQNAATNAVGLLTSLDDFHNLTEEQILGAFGTLQKGIFDRTFALAEGSTAQAVEQLTQAFPGAQVVPTAAPPAATQPAVAPVVDVATPPAPAASPAPAAAAPSNDTEALWRDYFGNPTGWWDNRGDKTNPNAPDFKKKVDRNASADEKKNAPALWLNGKVPTPVWVKQALGIA
jgi:hypothetical protein